MNQSNSEAEKEAIRARNTEAESNIRCREWVQRHQEICHELAKAGDRALRLLRKIKDRHPNL